MGPKYEVICLLCPETNHRGELQGKKIVTPRRCWGAAGGLSAVRCPRKKSMQRDMTGNQAASLFSNSKHYLEVLGEESARRCPCSLCDCASCLCKELLSLELGLHSRLWGQGLLCLGPGSVRQPAPVWTASACVGSNLIWGQGPCVSLHTTDSARVLSLCEALGS